MIELKIRLSKPEDLAKSLSRSWHPIVSLQQLFPKRLSAAMDYWNTLLPLNERFDSLSSGEPIPPGTFDLKDLVRMKAISEEQFRDMLDSLLLELKVKIGPNEKICYADFIYVADYQETILRAYLTSFLISEGAVVLQTNPLEEEYYLTLSHLDKSSYFPSYNSKVITIDHESWKKKLKGDSAE